MQTESNPNHPSAGATVKLPDDIERALKLERAGELDEALAKLDVLAQTEHGLDEELAEERVTLQAARDAIYAELDGTHPEPDAKEAPTSSRILEVNGFSAIRAQALELIQHVANLPIEALDAALAFHDQATTRLKLDTTPQAREALKVAETQGDYIRLARQFRVELGNLDERLQARDTITAGIHTGPPRNREERRKAKRGRH